MPAATTFIAVFAKMSSVLSRQALFYSTCIPFFIFYICFDLFIYQENLSEQSTLTRNDVVAKILTNWSSALFFIISEVYSSVSIGILFWKLANDVVDVEQAKRFYPLFAYMSSFAPIIAGMYVILLI